MNKKTWVLIADASKALIYAFHRALVYQEPENEKNLDLIAEYSHARGRVKERDLVSDRMGSYGAGSFAAHTQPKEYEAIEFARELANRLEEARKEHAFHDLILVSPSHFMGELNKNISNELKKLITQRIEKDYTKQSGRELLKSLVAYM